jgi:hypothetical protein
MYKIHPDPQIRIHGLLLLKKERKMIIQLQFEVKNVACPYKYEGRR